MILLTGSNVANHYVVLVAIQDGLIVVVLWPPICAPEDKVKKVLMGQAQPVGFRTRRNVGLVPNQVIAEYPALVLHGDREARRYQE